MTDINLSGLSGTDGFTIKGEAACDTSGRSVVNAGDGKPGETP